MSNFVVSARKYRPNKFEDVVGQEHVSQTLKNALQNDHLAHAFLFCGPRGVGKTTCARILAKVMNCQNITDNHEPCNTCSSCESFNKNASFNIIELDAASNNSVEHIRQLVEQVRFQPQQGKYKIFIIDEVHMLSQAAFNAFLKTLEEPPPYAIFILATTEKHKIIPTILSRCQIFDFKRIQVQSMVSHLQGICEQEGIDADKDALHIIAQKADGALRDSLSIFDRIISFSNKKLTYEDVITNLNVLDYDYFFKVTDALLSEDISNLMLIYDDILRKGFESDIFMLGLAEHLRNLLVCKDRQTLQLLEVSDKLKVRYQEQANLAPTSFVLTALGIANDCDVNYKMARNKRLHTEMALIKMAYICRAISPSSTLVSNNSIEKKTIDASNSIKRPNSNQKKQVSVQQTATKNDTIVEGRSNNSVSSDSSTPVHDVQAAGGSPARPELQSTQKDTYSEDANPQPSVVREPESQKIKTKSAPSSSSGFSLNLADIEASVTSESAKKATNEEQKAALTLERVQEVWNTYIANADSANLQNIMKMTEITLNSDNEIGMAVTSTLAENTIKQDYALMDYLRTHLERPALLRKLFVDKSKVLEINKPKKVLTDRDKLKMMNEVNPLVEKIFKKFDLKMED